MSADGDLKKIIRRAQDQGFRHMLLSNSHHRFYAPDGKTIVQCSSTKTGRDDGWVHGFMAELRRAGYKTEQDEAKEAMKMNGVNGATTNLGELLKGAIEAAPAAAPRGRGAFTEAIRDFLRTHDEKAHSTADVGIVIRSRGFDQTNEAIGVTLARLVTQGEVKRIGTGMYKWRAAEPQAAAPVPATAAPAAYTNDDERELDEALASLGRLDTKIRGALDAIMNEAMAEIGRIEAVVRRYKGVAQQFAELKRLLNKTEFPGK